MIIDSTFNLFKKNYNNYDKIRCCSLMLSTHYPRTLSLFSSECNENYAMRVQRKSDRMVKDNHVAPSDSLQLKYITSKSQNN